MWLVVGLALLSRSSGQTLITLEDDTRNIFSQQSATDWPPPAPSLDVDPRTPTDWQWESGTAFGGWLTTRIKNGSGDVVAGSPDLTEGPTSLIVPSSGNNLTLGSVKMARPLVGRLPTVAFGDVISRPLVDNNGLSVDFLPQPDNFATGKFYYSPHARVVYATQIGVVDVVWRFRIPPEVGPATLTIQHIVGASPSRPARRIFWTEKGFNGPVVSIPQGPVSEVNVIYSPQFPSQVATEYESPFNVPPDPLLQLGPELRTLWYGTTDRSLHAYNAEGRVFVEFLGALTQDGTHQPLTTEVIEVIREVAPLTVRSYVGEKILPSTGDETLQARVVNGITSNPPFLYQHVLPSLSGRRDYYAIATTNQSTLAPDNPTGEILTYWMETGTYAVQWPRYYNSYIITWPDSTDPEVDIDEYYTRYIRQDSADGDAAATGIVLNVDNNSGLVFQNDPTSGHAKVEGGTLFYTSVSAANPWGYSLIRHSSGENIWFERVYSQLDSTAEGFELSADAIVGARIEPPVGHEAALGYIRKVKVGEDFKPAPFDATAYADPFVDGIELAKKGAIIPVNTRTDDDLLEVWWYKQSTPPAGSGIKSNFFPVVAANYKLKWPENPDRIIMARNDGTGDLPSVQANGLIYFQNDPTLDGFNPNDEHALMLAGRGYALRDDLATEQTSQPWVLVRYTETDGRPAIRPFHVSREDLAQDISFTYEVEAGRVLQAPFPLPLLPPVLDGKVPANREVSPGTEDLPTNSGAPSNYKSFTYTDRKGTVWLYRGPHDGEGSGLVRMQYYYPSQPGFYVPGLAEQPAPGTAMPYLRAFDPATRSWIGEPTGIANQPLHIAFEPSWPAFAPVLNLGESLTLPVRGLPAVRGQTSLEVLYDQSVAKTTNNKNVILHDPTVARTSDLKTHELDLLPASIPTNIFRGKTYFPSLPPHLVERFYFDPNLGQKGSIVLVGEFKDEILGDDYLLLNVLSTKDRADLENLCDATDPDRSEWLNALTGLHAVLRPLVEDKEVRGTFVPAQSATAAKIAAIREYIENDESDGPEWDTRTTAPTAREVREKAGLGNGDDVNNAITWMEKNMGALKGLAVKQNEATAKEKELESLRSSFSQHIDFLFVLDTFGFVPDAQEKQLHDIYAAWIFSGDRAWNSTIGKALTASDFNPPGATLSTFISRLHAWDWVGKKRNQLEQWDRAVTDLAAVKASLAKGFEDFEATATKTVPASELADVTRGDIPVDSYALTAHGGGEGWVVLLAGDSEALSPAEEPVSIHILRVSNPLGRGELKVIQPSNPLSEKLTLQQSQDFAGEPSEYDFEWRTLPPVLGQPPVVYTFTSSTIFGDSSWTINGTAETQGLPGQVLANTGDNTAVELLSKDFSLTELPFRAFLSLDLGSSDGARVKINGTEVVRYRVPLPDDGDVQTPREFEPDTGTVTPPLPSFAPLEFVFEVPISLMRTASDNTIEVEPYSFADVGSATRLNVRLESMSASDSSETWGSVGPLTGETAGAGSSVIGRNRYVIEGNSIFTLTDNYFICRYRARETDHAAYTAYTPDMNDLNDGWSKWTSPQLAEGWIKRALAGINPFEQRITNLFDNDVNTDVSLVTQAGKRWEGDVALNLENIDEFGLIEIYETILRRGKSLSIEGAPAINYGPANDALLLAAGYLADLYSILGNEAAADAANPTIAFSTNSGEFGDIATSLFAFKGQLATVLDEELALLRGRDDFLAPGSQLRPIFNRLVWNYTRGIDSGEAVYALNYNIKDLDSDGAVGAADAAQAYPQGHGDAYGHYLTAVTNYYSLLWNPEFSWTPRVEAVSVLGQPVTVDYFDERKFAGAAAAWVKTAAQVTDLTYRHDYSPADENSGSWAHLSDGRSNSQTGVIRDWGTDDWAARGGQGAYFHWLTANSMLPSVDPNPAHEGIQKVDRTTVPEIQVLVSQSEEIQSVIDRANAGLNPLGISLGAVPFDISPTQVDQGKTHFEQVYDRAVIALGNAATAFDSAKDVTRLLRSQDDSLEERREAIFAQESAFAEDLKEIYGTPYAEDIGPGKTYSQGYEGPDLVNYVYVDIPELQKNSTGSREQTTYRIVQDPDFSAAMNNSSIWEKLINPQSAAGHNFDLSTSSGRIELVRDDHNSDPWQGGDQPGIGKLVTYELDDTMMFRKPLAFQGRRSRPGQIQQAIGNVLLARLHLSNAVEDHDHFARDAGRIFRNYKAAVDAHESTRDLMLRQWATDGAFEGAINIIEHILSTNDVTTKVTSNLSDVLKEALPKVVGLANDATAPARSAFEATQSTSDSLNGALKLTLEVSIRAIQTAQANLARDVELSGFDVAWNAEHLQMLTDLKGEWEAIEDRRRTTDIAIREYQNAVEEMRAVIGRGEAIQDSRAAFRTRAAAIIQGYRTKDFGFRAFRNEALESYKSLFDLASRYTYLAARAYDYETGLVDAENSSAASQFYQSIMRSRAVGVFANGVPQPAGSTGGDPGLSGALARMNSDWSVVKSRFGFNNPDRYRTAFSLRRELKRFVDGPDGDIEWQDFLSSSYLEDIQEDQDVRRYCMNVNPAGSLTVPGLVIEFNSTINTGFNFFGKPLAGGDSTFSPTSFSTKIRSTGIAFPGYIGMASPTSLGGPLAGTGADSPDDPGAGFDNPDALSATPYIYVIPAGLDSMRSPSPVDSNIVRTWQIEDQAIPLPFDIGGAFSGQNLTASGTLTEAFTLRKHQAFRAVPDGTVFSAAPGFTNSRLIGRSVWNNRWKIIIPGHTLSASPGNGLKTFRETVDDVLLYFETYSYSGN
jgi:hypothetical protein